MTLHDQPLNGARSRVLAVATILVAIVWSIAPGQIQPDTKFNLVESPWQYLARSFSSWNSQAGLGELQNQAYGYLFPMGLVFGIGDSLGLPDWATQRLWWSLLLLVGFFGAYVFAVRLGRMSSDIAVVVALVYLISPRLLSVLAQISVEAWPAAVAPWLILAAGRMVGADRRGAEVLRGAAWTSLLVISLGGVNATASLAVLILPFLWLLTSPAGTRKLRAILAWLTAAAAGAAWWLIPLFVLGNYGYPFLDYIETSRITTAVTSLPNVLRGANHWVAYILDSAGHPVWQSGWVQAQYVLAVVAGTCVVAAAVLGLMRIRVANAQAHLSRFAFTSLLLGLVIMSIGYAGAFSSPISPFVQTFLDGAGAPFRNVHKFDPLVRLPIALGLGVALAWLISRQSAWAKPAVAVIAIATLVSPVALWVGRVGDAHGFVAVPSEWRTVAGMVDELAVRDGGSTLVLPHARTPNMTWGKVSDEPLSVLAQSPVTIRSAAPLGHPGGTRILDAIDTAVGSGLRYDSLAELMNRMGIARVVVRNDVASSIHMHDADQVIKTFELSPGFERLENVGSHISVWSVGKADEAGPRLYAQDNEVSVAGVPEDLLWLLESGAINSGNSTSIAPGLRDADIATDGFRWRIWNSGVLPAWGTSELLSPYDQGPGRIGLKQLPPNKSAELHSTRQWLGLDKVTASSSASDPRGRLTLGSGFSPAAAVDGDTNTSWWSDVEREAWLKFDMPEPVDLGKLTLTLDSPSSFAMPRSIQLEVIDGTGKSATVEQSVPQSGIVRIDLSGKETSRFLIKFPRSGSKTVRAISEVSSTEVDFGSHIALPGAIDFGSTDLLLTAESAGAGSVLVGRYLIERAAEGLHQRSWNMDVSAKESVVPEVDVRASHGPELEQLLDAGQYLSSQRIGRDPRTRPGAAFDLDSETRWRVPAGQAEATVEIRWDTPRRIKRLDVEPHEGTVRLRNAGRLYRLSSTGGAVNLTTDTLEVTFTRPPHLKADEEWFVPETNIAGAPLMKKRIETPCQDIEVTSGEQKQQFRIQTSSSSLMTGASLAAEPCLPTALSVEAGSQTVSIQTSNYLSWVSLRLAAVSSVPTVASESSSGVTIHQQSPTQQTFSVAASKASLLTIGQGFNHGWQAIGASGKVYQPRTIDGWQQSFEIPASTNERVTVRFIPQRAHVIGLVLGPIVALMAILILLFSRRSAALRPLESANQPLSSWRSRFHDLGPILGVAPMLGIAVLFAGWQGVIIAAVVAVVPQRWLLWIGPGSFFAAGLSLAFLGVVDHASLGALWGQVLALVTVVVLVRWWFVSERNPELASPRETTKASPEEAST